MDKIKQSAPSRIINVSCKAYKSGKINFDDLNSSNSYDDRHAYNQSKLANVLFTYQLNEILNGTGVTVNTVDPGVVDTELLRYTPLYKSDSSQFIIGSVFKMFTKTPFMGAQEIIRIAVNPELKDTSGKYFR